MEPGGEVEVLRTAEPAWERVVFLHPLAESPAIWNGGFAFVRGQQTSVLQAAVRLQRAGYSCRLSREIKEPAIYVVHPDYYRPSMRKAAGCFLVWVRNDRESNPWAPVEIVQNPRQARPRYDRPCFYVPYFPQIGLIPRDHETRRDRFETIQYYGRQHNLHRHYDNPAFLAWAEANGMQFRADFDPSHWHDYSQVDAVLAVRDYHHAWPNKPASKLVNCWRAGVPALLGPESCFQAFRRTELDYFEIRSLEQAKRVLLHLKADPALRRQIRENGERRQSEISFDGVTQAWAAVLDRHIKPLARVWFENEWVRRQANWRARYLWTGVGLARSLRSCGRKLLGRRDTGSLIPAYELRQTGLE